MRQTLAKFMPVLLIGTTLWGLWSLFFYPRLLWLALRRLEIDVAVVDYTVPSDDYRKHRGLFWLLSHLRVRPPSGNAWELDHTMHYTGYYPSRPKEARRISRWAPIAADVVYVADTYGVYHDDVHRERKGQAQPGYSPLVFGGLNQADARALRAFADGGGDLFVEFNSICEPTTDVPRAEVEQALGVGWTGWVGRVFVDPTDEQDVPRWLPKVWAEQFADRPLPDQPQLALVHRTGKLLLCTSAEAKGIAPWIELTAAGRARFPDALGEARYYYWFGLFAARDAETVTHAELVLPPACDDKALAKAGLPRRVPLLTERPGPAGSSRYYIAADLADLDFAPPSHDLANAIDFRRKDRFGLNNISNASAFFRFYAPVMRRLIRQIAERRGKRRRRPGDAAATSQQPDARPSESGSAERR